MPEIIWAGVMPAVTTPFRDDLSVDHDFLKKHCKWLVENGATGIVPLGSLGEGATLSYAEKLSILESCVEAVEAKVPIVPGISSLSTAEASTLAVEAKRRGCRGLMVLPAYVHSGSWRETKNHFDTVISSTNLSCMLYNNPIAYGTDVKPEQLALLTEQHDNLRAVKESSGDVRRITAIKSLLGDRVSIFVGLDDAVVEGVACGASGWVAGLVNALPAESIRLFDAAVAGDVMLARKMYDWFLPLLRMDTVPEFVQLIKLVQQEVGMGTETVRPPRLPLIGAEKAAALSIIKDHLNRNPC